MYYPPLEHYNFFISTYFCFNVVNFCGMLMRIFLLILGVLFISNQLLAQEIGPKNGSLVIVGGGRVDPEVLQNFIALAGGPDASIVIIPTASGLRDFGPAYKGRAFRPFLDQGASNLSLLHTDDPEVANSDAFVEHIQQATGVWFSGGRQWRLADAYLGTKTEKALNDLLDRGGVIGGTSAGASIQGSYLVRGDTQTNTIMMGDHEKGFGFLKNVGIDQHLLKRNRQFDMIEVIKAQPELLGIGLDEGTAIIVSGDTFRVVGSSYVAIYDIEIINKSGAFYFLSDGDLFNLKTRKAERASWRMNDLSLPKSITGEH